MAADGKPLPYLDRIVLEVVPDQNAELLRLQSGQSDLPQDAIRSEDYVPVRRSEEQGALKMVELGVSLDADALWFCLKPAAKKKDPRFAFVSRKEFRQALSHAVDREAFAQTVFLGEAVPVWGTDHAGQRHLVQSEPDALSPRPGQGQGAPGQHRPRWTATTTVSWRTNAAPRRASP